MGKPVATCPVCKRFVADGARCKQCYSDKDEKNIYDDFPGSFNGKFFPDEFGIVKDKFGIEER